MTTSRRQIFEYHPVIGYRFIPGLRFRVPYGNTGYLIQTNNLGFRCNHDVASSNPPGKFRICLFGDSFTAGDGVSNGQRYSDIIEKQLENVEILNFGMPGTGLDQQYLIFNEFVNGKIEYNALILGVLVENIIRNISHYRYFENEKGEMVCYMKPYFDLSGDKLIPGNIPPAKNPLSTEELDETDRSKIANPQKKTEKRSLIERLLAATRNSSLKKIAVFQNIYLYLKYSFKLYYPQYKDPESYGWKLMKKILEEWIAVKPESTILMPLPTYIHVMKMNNSKWYRKRFNEIGESTGCILHDPLPELKKYKRKEREGFFLEYDQHLTIEGHLAVAKSLLPVINKLKTKSEKLKETN